MAATDRAMGPAAGAALTWPIERLQPDDADGLCPLSIEAGWNQVTADWRLMLSLEELRVNNARVICHDAVEVLTHQVAPRALAEVVILFPDPWPKKRHHKRRLVQAPFVELVADRLRCGGVLRFASDWQPYADAVLEVLNANAQLHNLADDGTFVPRPTERTPTRFEKRGERLGHDVWDLAFERR